MGAFNIVTILLVLLASILLSTYETKDPHVGDFLFSVSMGGFLFVAIGVVMHLVWPLFLFRDQTWIFG